MKQRPTEKWGGEVTHRPSRRAGTLAWRRTSRRSERRTRRTGSSRSFGRAAPASLKHRTVYQSELTCTGQHLHH